MILIKEQHRNRLAFRYPSMEMSLQWFDSHQGKVAIETGCVRQPDDYGGGMSTVIFGEYFKDHPGTFYSVDISKTNLDIAKSLCTGLPVNFIESDSLAYLQDFKDTVDFLYLDSLDCEPDPRGDNRVPQTHQLNEFKAIESRLSPHAVVLLDDCGFENGGKGRLTRAYLKDNGWMEIWNDYQSCWIR